MYKCKEAAWKRCIHEYLAAPKKDILSLAKKELCVHHLVTIKQEEKYRDSLKIGVVDQLYMGKDNAISSVRLRFGKKFTELQ